RVPDTVLATLLFTDLVGSTARAAALGDTRWRELLAQHLALVRRELERYRGSEVDAAGDGFFARFDGPARAIACAREVIAGTRALGIELRAGIHTGECELVDGKPAGVSVHVGARVSARAEPGEVLVTGTVKDLVAGSGIAFEPRGEQELKGVPGTWPIYAVADA
ncbi:MAG TPA: adenylate/guanylate cyclase domain-containing protein, partial [Gaiellaceae bacterium]|nr:adenylate/guanylate cyclase domain-containing protein [Gaiellaceae bacterium]